MAKVEEGAHAALQTHLEDMRKLTECKICLKPFYEPFILACGHTYCYGCLRSWFGGPAEKKNKNCPDCRTTVKIMPAPNYVLREMTHMFVGRIELLPEDESVEQHVRDMEAEAEMLTEDRNRSGLFQGVFKPTIYSHVPHLPIPDLRGAIRDYEDGVDRCPVCTWEIEDGVCPGCGLQLGDSDDSMTISISDDEDEVGLDSPSSGSDSVSSRLSVEGITRFYGLESSEVDSSEEEAEEGFHAGSVDLDNYDAHDDFVDDTNEVDADDMDGLADHDGYPEDASTPYSVGTEYTIHGSHNDGSPYTDGLEWDDHTVPQSMPPHRHLIYDSDDEHDEDDISQHGTLQASAGTSHPSRPARSRPTVVIDSEDEEDEEEQQPPLPSFHAPESPSTVASHNSEGEEESRDSESNSEDSSTNSNAPATPRLNLTSDSSSESSDDTAIPPQTGQDRRKRLQSQRARRPPSERETIDLVTPPARREPHGRISNNAAVPRNRRRSRITPVH